MRPVVTEVAAQPAGQSPPAKKVVKPLGMASSNVGRPRNSARQQSAFMIWDAQQQHSRETMRNSKCSGSHRHLWCKERMFPGRGGYETVRETNVRSKHCPRSRDHCRAKALLFRTPHVHGAKFGRSR